jgi:hypothetical protein
MRIYFYDKNYRAVGNRELNEGEAVPANATTVTLILPEGKQAHFINGEWAISDIEITNEVSVSTPSIETRLDAAEAVIMDMLEMMMV